MTVKLYLHNMTFYYTVYSNFIIYTIINLRININLKMNILAFRDPYKIGG